MSNVPSSRLRAARRDLESILDAGDVDRTQLGDDLFAITELLDTNFPLRSALVDPARAGDDRAGLARSLLQGRVGEPALDLLASLVHGRWVAPRELPDATEALAVDAVAAAADQAGRLSVLEDELFRFERTVDGNTELRRALADESAPSSARAGLVDRLLEGKAAPETVRLARQAVLAPRGMHVNQALAQFIELAAFRRQQTMAHVVSATPLDPDQVERLASGLARVYGREIHVNLDVDPAVIGGLRVEIGDEVLDGTMASRLQQTRRHLAG